MFIFYVLGVICETLDQFYSRTYCAGMDTKSMKQGTSFGKKKTFVQTCDYLVFNYKSQCLIFEIPDLYIQATSSPGFGGV